MVFIASRDRIKFSVSVMLLMSLTKSQGPKQLKNKPIQKFQKKDSSVERRGRSHNKIPCGRTKVVNGQMRIIYCKTCYYHSSAAGMYDTGFGLYNRCPECTSEGLEYFLTSTTRLCEYILNNIN